MGRTSVRPGSTRLAAFAVSMLLASSASAGTIWWVAEGVDDGWDTPFNWVYPSHRMATPNPDESAYITTGLHHGLSNPPPAEIGGGVVARTETLYVGGWIERFDEAHGDPVGHTGELDITGGELNADGYIQMGTRGARGEIYQSGGKVSARQVNLAPHTGGSAYYELSGGELKAHTFTVGNHGQGTFDMTGGKVKVGGTMFVARGVTDPSKPSTWTQSGGALDTPRLIVGNGAASVGALRIGGPSARVKVGSTFDIGRKGQGEVVQTGGKIEVGWRLYLGREAGSFGQYTIDEGTFRQTSVVGGVYVGDAGVGALSLGPAADVDIAGFYRQNGLSTLTVALDGSANRDPISVGGYALFQAGAKLEILLEEGYVPGFEESFPLLTAGLGVFDYGLQIVGANASDWSLDTTTGNSLVATYVHPGVSVAPNPEPDAVLLFAVGGLIVARAVRRRAPTRR